MKKKWKVLTLFVDSIQQYGYNQKRNIQKFYINKNVKHIKTYGTDTSVNVGTEVVNRNKYVKIEKKSEIEKTLETEIEETKRKNKKKEQREKIKTFNLKNLKLFSICFFTSLLCYATLKKVPEGYVCIIENKKNQTVPPYIYDDKMTFFYNPLKYKVIFMRIIPIHKKYDNIYETLDKKKIKVLLEVKMKPKIPFIIEIYKSFGSNYSFNYIEREMNLDIKNVVNQFNLKTFFESDESEKKSENEKRSESEKEENLITPDDIVDQIMERFYDSSIFYKINIMDVSILFQKVE